MIIGAPSRRHHKHSSIAPQNNEILALPGPQFLIDFSSHSTCTSTSNNHVGDDIDDTSTTTCRTSSLLPVYGWPRFIVAGHTITLDEGLPLVAADGPTQAMESSTQREPLHTTLTSQRLWDCSIVLSSYLRSLHNAPSTTPLGNEDNVNAKVDVDAHAAHWLKGLNIVELGAGTAPLVSITSSLLGAHVVATDLPETMTAMRHNFHLNRLTK
jgi:hypothetical protein